MMTIRAQLVGAYCGIVCMAVFLIGFWGIAGFVPPPSPQWDADTVAAFFGSHTTRIRIGMLVTMLAAALLLPWNAAIAVQMKRIEGRHSMLTYVQIMSGACLVLEFIFPTAAWQTAAFRLESSPELIQRLNDLAWLPFLGILSTAVIQGFALGIVILSDKRSEPAFPRWAGYFNFWIVMMLFPAGLIYFFKTGPFAWDGLLAWWLVLVCFAAWVVVDSIVLIGAIKHQQRNTDVEFATNLDELAAEVELLRRETATRGAVSRAGAEIQSRP